MPHGSAPITRHLILAVACGLTILSLSSARAANVTMEATNNSTIKPAGPRTGTSNLSFFNVEGDNAAANASFGVADFTGSSFAFGGTVTSITSIQLLLTESNAAFSLPGALNFYLSQDNATGISNTGTPATPNYQSAAAPNGIGTQFTPFDSIGNGAYNTTGNVNSGQVDTFTLTLTSAEATYFVTQLNNGGNIRLLIAPGDNAIAATYAGYNNSTLNGPQLTINAVVVPEPAQFSLLAFGSLLLCRRRLLRPRRAPHHSPVPLPC